MTTNRELSTMSHAVVRTNLRTGARYIMAWMPSAQAAADRAARSNELHRACKMTHMVDRAISGDPKQIRQRWTTTTLHAELTGEVAS